VLGPTETGGFTYMFVCVDLLLVFGGNIVGITEKVSIGKLPFSQSFGWEKKAFLMTVLLDGGQHLGPEIWEVIRKPRELTAFSFLKS